MANQCFSLAQWRGDNHPSPCGYSPSRETITPPPACTPTEGGQYPSGETQEQFPYFWAMAMRGKWMFKALVQKTLSVLPGSHHLNYLFQRHVTKGVQLSDQYFSDKLQHARDHIRLYRAHTGRNCPSSTIELGTGWYPIVPFYFYLCGAENVMTTDISRHCKPGFALETARRILDEIPDEPGFQDDRKAQLTAWLQAPKSDTRTMLSPLGIDYRVGDARQSGLPGDSVEFIHSNNTFEHVYPDILRDILKEFRRIGKPDGLHSHFIDMSDHFAHMDSSISIYHFLRYSEAQWKRIDNSIQPQNRWRLSQYHQLFRETGYQLITEEIRPGHKAQLEKEPLHSSYTSFDTADLAVSHAHVLLRSE